MVQAAQAAIDSRSRRFMSELWPHLFSEIDWHRHQTDLAHQEHRANQERRMQLQFNNEFRNPHQQPFANMPPQMPDINTELNILARLQKLEETISQKLEETMQTQLKKPLAKAIEDGNLHEIEKLLIGNPSLINQPVDGQSGSKPFLFALKNNPRLDILKMLLFVYGANINEWHVYQATREHPAFGIYPLNAVILKDFPEKLKIIEFLRQNGAGATYHPHKSLLHYVLNQHDLNPQLISLLIKYYSEDLNVQDEAKGFPFDFFLQRINALQDRHVFPAREFKETIKTFLRHDAKRQPEIKLNERTQQLLMEAQEELAAEEDQAAIALMLESPRRNTQFAVTMAQLLAPQPPKSQK